MHAHDFVYAVPPRVSLAQAHALVAAFLGERSGGERGLAVAAALFDTFGKYLGIFTDVRRGLINAADVATGAAGDLECLGADGSIRLAVEVKERSVTENDVAVILAKARAAGVREILLCTEGVLTSDKAIAADLVAKAWASGTNVYHVTILELIRVALPLLGEEAVTGFVGQIGRQLDTFTTQPMHRLAWKMLLDNL